MDPCDPFGIYPLPPLPDDIDGSGAIDSIDLNIVRSEFGCIGDECEGDIDADGDVDSADLNGVLAGFGT